MGSLSYSAMRKTAMVGSGYLKLIFILYGFLHGICTEALSDSERISALEKQVEKLKASLDAIEPLLEARYGLIRHCEQPVVPNGQAMCSKILKPGTKCYLKCSPGYIATPGKRLTKCRTGGVWSAKLRCEIPLLLISGGTVDTRNTGYSGVESVTVHPSTGCDIKLPDMPLAGESHRSLHNLIYVSPNKLLACNGLTSEEEASCDSLDLFDLSNEWIHHSYPNQYLNSLHPINCKNKLTRELNKDTCDKQEEQEKEKKKGVYAAQSVNVGNNEVLAGGMSFDKSGHTPLKSVKKLGGGTTFTYWPKEQGMNNNRAFFCAVNIKDRGFLAIGGLSNDGNGNNVEKSVEYKNVGGSYFGDLNIHARNMADLNTPRSGHSCAALNGYDESVIVSGGTKGFGHGEAALKGVEILNATQNTWVEVEDMNMGRFGHALVVIGDKVVALGGDTKVPSNILDTIEEYDISSNSWKVLEKRLKKPRANFGFTLVPHSIFDGCVIQD